MVRYAGDAYSAGLGILATMTMSVMQLRYATHRLFVWKHGPVFMFPKKYGSMYMSNIMAKSEATNFGQRKR